MPENAQLAPNVLNIPDLTPREFTLDERRLFEATMARYNIETLGKELVETKLAVDNPVPETEINILERVIEKLNEEINKQLADGNWNSAERKALTAELKEAETDLHQHTVARNSRTLDSNSALDQQTADLMELQDNANMEIIHAVLTSRGVELPPVSEVLALANTADYDLANELVEFGARSFPLSRASRRLAQRRKPSRGLN